MKLFLSLVGFCMQIKLTLSDELEEMVLQIHNQHRIEAGLISLEWNETLAQQASANAEAEAENTQCKKLLEEETSGESSCLMERLTHVQPGYIGYTCSKGFYDQVKAYYFPGDQKAFDACKGKGFDIGDYGRLTQMMWMDSTQVGCGLAQCPDKNATISVILKCKYNPPGNVAGQPLFLNDNYRRIRGAEGDQNRWLSCNTAVESLPSVKPYVACEEPQTVPESVQQGERSAHKNGAKNQFSLVKYVLILVATALIVF